MSFFSCSACKSHEKHEEQLRAQLVDQAESFLRQQQAFERERAMLLDKILAIATPGASRELARTSSYNPIPRERRPTEHVSTPYSTPGAPRPPVEPRPGRLRVREAPPAQDTTPEQAAAELTAPPGGDRQVG